MPKLPYPNPTSAAVTAVMRGNKRRDTGPETAIRSRLQRLGIRFRKEYAIDAHGIRARADIAFPRQRVAVFIDGCFWHRCPAHGNTPQVNTGYWLPKLSRNVARDRLVDEGLHQTGWTPVRIWEHVSPDVAIKTILGLISDGEVISDRIRRSDTAK
jgi:DNA mismatch endonuclease (patch repair protein)